MVAAEDITYMYELIHEIEAMDDWEKRSEVCDILRRKLRQFENELGDRAMTQSRTIDLNIKEL